MTTATLDRATITTGRLIFDTGLKETSHIGAFPDEIKAPTRPSDTEITEGNGDDENPGDPTTEDPEEPEEEPG